MLLLPEGCLVRLLLPLLFLLRELDEADVEADLNSSDNTTVIEGQLKKGGKLFLTPNIFNKFFVFAVRSLKSRKKSRENSKLDEAEVEADLNSFNNATVFSFLKVWTSIE